MDEIEQRYTATAHEGAGELITTSEEHANIRWLIKHHYPEAVCEWSRVLMYKDPWYGETIDVMEWWNLKSDKPGIIIHIHPSGNMVSHSYDNLNNHNWINNL